MDERVKKWLEEHDGDEYCNYCKYKLICGGKIIPGPNGPIYAPCADGNDFINVESLIEAIENGDEDV